MNDKKLKKIRKQYKEKKVLYRDKIAFRTFSKCHYLTREQLKTLNFSESSLNRYLETGTLETKEIISRGKSLEVYKISEYGKDWLQKDVFKEQMNFYNSTGVEHDLKIGEILVSLLENKIIEVDEFKSEYDLRDEFREHINNLRSEGQDERADELEEMREQGTISIPDYSYSLGSNTYIQEIVTNSGAYTKEHLESKQAFANVMNYGKVDYIKI